MQFQAPKGTFDLLPYGQEEPWKQVSLWQYAEKVIRETAADYGYHEIRTPVYERTELFDRGIGETSDIVMKEMFTFQDRGDRSMSLRPEGTASVMRSFVEHQLSQIQPVHKLFYIAPMFRYERPQSGRYRQHHQFGVEAIGSKEPAQDAEVIDFLCETYRRLGLKNLRVDLNSVGDIASRLAYRNALQDYLRPHFKALSLDSQARFEKNPLRILDSKDPKDRTFLEGAPSILHSLSPSSKEHFETLLSLLDENQIPYRVNDRIVRGLDYYCNTVFEVTVETLGSQNSIGGGGRYDGLIGSFGGPDLPGVGFGTGMERILQTLLAQNVALPTEPGPLLYLLPLGDEARRACFRLATLCRHHGISTELDLHSKKIQPGLQQAIRCRSVLCGIVGSEELTKNVVQLKVLESRHQEEISQDGLIDYCKNHMRKKS
jgi:histidyl-tRNA synthetase